MDRTNANGFRTHLKEWMEAAQIEPIKITRKSGESFVLLNADDFEKMQVELASLRGIARGLNDVVQGRTRKGMPSSTEAAIERAKDRVLGKSVKKATA